MTDLVKRRAYPNLTNPFMVYEIDPLTKRPTFFVPWKTERPVQLLKKRKWHSLECSRCGRRRRCAVYHHKKTGAPWVCIMARAWADEHACEAKS